MNASFAKNPLLVDDLIAYQQVHDFAGSGYGDVIAFYPDGIFYVIGSNGSEFVDAGEWVSGVGNATSVPLVGDFGGDGKSDVAAMDLENGEITVALSSGSSFNNRGSWITGFGEESLHQLAGDPGASIVKTTPR